MRIIKKGKIKSEKVYACTCKECKTIFEFQQKEANICYDQRDGDVLQIACPLCKKNCYVGV